jgi:FkbH-like protein
MIEVHRIGESRRHQAFLRERGMKTLDPADAVSLGLEQFTALSVQFPGEHCTECAAPDCHDSCDLFERSGVGRCRRFADGIVVSRRTIGPFPYSLEVLFKPWAQILCVGNTWCVSPARYRFLSRLSLWIGRLSYLAQCALRVLPARMHWRVADKIRGGGNRVPRWMNRLAARGHGVLPDTLVCVVGNPHDEALTIEIGVSGFANSQKGRSFRKTEIIPRGWHSIRVPVREIAEVIDLRQLFRVSVVPLIDKPMLLQFLYIGFAAGGQQPPPHPAPAKVEATAAGPKVKLLVVDLDETLWDGILIENPDRGIALRPGVREALETLDQRGVLLSVASKNNYDDARRILETVGIWDLFLYPKISWEPKSASIGRIVRELNIGLAAAAFVDDSEFERAEVKAALPEVRVFDAHELPTLPTRLEFIVSTTEESRRRRFMYKTEEQRQTAFAESALDYDAFLTSCKMTVVLELLNAGNRDRVCELVQRTNQLNFSGNHYSRESLDSVVRQREVAPIVMRCRDRFGDYGIVGFAVLKMDRPEIEVSDLMFSCRVQGKKVEHSVLTYLMQQAQAGGISRCRCRFKRTDRNAPAGAVLADLGFTRDATHGPTDPETYSRACRAEDSRQYPVSVVDGAGLSALLAVAAPPGDEQRVMGQKT